jgi:hypothetical protein
VADARRPCDPPPGVDVRLTRGYNSHGDWSTLAEIRELELERENDFPELPGCPDDTPAMWVTRTPRQAVRYGLSASRWEDITAGGPLTEEERAEMEAIASRPIELLPTDRIVVDDGDDGYLVLRPAGAVERCVDCGKEIPGVRAPAEHPELSGSFMCPECARKEGLPTAADLGLGRGPAPVEETPKQILDAVWARLDCAKRKPAISLRRQHATGLTWTRENKITIREDSWRKMHPAERRIVVTHEALHGCGIGHQPGFRTAVDSASTLIYRDVWGEDAAMRDFERVLQKKLDRIRRHEEGGGPLVCDPGQPNGEACE